MKPNIHISILKNPEKSIDFFLTSIKLLCNIYFAVAKYILQCRCSSVVEHQPSKLDMWVRFPSPALAKPRNDADYEVFSCKFYRAVGGQWPDLKAECLVYKLGMPCLPRTIKIHK